MHYTQGLTNDVDNFFTKMISCGLSPTLYSYSILFNAHGKAKNGEKLMGYLDHMIANRVIMTDRITWTGLKHYFLETLDYRNFKKTIGKLKNAKCVYTVQVEMLCDYIIVLGRVGRYDEMLFAAKNNEYGLGQAAKKSVCKI